MMQSQTFHRVVILQKVPERSCGRVPVGVTSTGNCLKIRSGSSVRCFTDGRKLGFSKQSDLSFGCRGLPRRNFQLRSRSLRLHAAALQAVTADGDSSNGEGACSTNHALNLSSAWFSQDLLVSSLQGLQEGLRDLKERGLQNSRRTAGEIYSRLQTMDRNSLFKNITWSESGEQAGRAWQNLKPWIKWPIAIFAAAFLAVWITCGKVVAEDLIPLWIIGPLIAGSIIRISCMVGDLTLKGLAIIEPLRQSAIRGTLEVLEDAKKGVLIDKLRNTLEQKNTEMKQEVAKKWSNFVLYVKSGQAAADFRVFLILEFSRFYDWSTERYLDFAEWVRPYWRAFSRIMRKLF